MREEEKASRSMWGAEKEATGIGQCKLTLKPIQHPRIQVQKPDIQAARQLREEVLERGPESRTDHLSLAHERGDDVRFGVVEAIRRGGVEAGEVVLGRGFGRSVFGLGAGARGDGAVAAAARDAAEELEQGVGAVVAAGMRAEEGGELVVGGYVSRVRGGCGFGRRSGGGGTGDAEAGSGVHVGGFFLALSFLRGDDCVVVLSWIVAAGSMEGA